MDPNKPVVEMAFLCSEEFQDMVCAMADEEGVSPGFILAKAFGIYYHARKELASDFAKFYGAKLAVVGENGHIYLTFRL
jgi:hypothetical protein